MTSEKTTVLNWLLAILMVIVLAMSLPVIQPERWELWILFAGLMALVVNFTLPFSAGEISAAHTVSLTAYLTLGSEETIAPVLWSITIGSLIGHSWRQYQRQRWQSLAQFISYAGGAILVGTSQQTLGLFVADFVYHALDGELPLASLQYGDLLPIIGFVATFLAVYLAILLLDARIRAGSSPRRLLNNQWQPLAAVLLVPLPLGVLGAVVYAQISALAFGMMIIGLLMIITGVFTLSQTRQASQQQVLELSSLSQVGRALRVHLDFATLMVAVKQQIFNLMNVRSVTVALYDLGRLNIIFPLNIRNNQPNPRPARAPGNELIDHVMKTGEPLLLAENVHEQAKALGLESPTEPMQSWLGVPLLTSNYAFGCIAIVSDSADRVFTEQDTRLLSAVATQISNSIENVRLYEQTQRHAEQLKALSAATGEMGRTLDPTRVLDAICRYAPSVAGAQAAAVFLFWNSDNLGYASSTGFEGMVFERNPLMPMLTEHQHRVAVTSPPVIIMDTHLDPRAERFRSTLDSLGKRALVETVLSNPQKNELFGILVIYYNEPTYIGSDQLDVIHNFARQGALSFSNSQLYSQTDAALSRRVGQLAVLAETGREMTAIHDLQALFDLVLSRALQGTSSSVGGLIIGNNEPGNEKPRISASSGYNADVAHFTEAASKIHHEVFKTGAPMLLSNLKEQASVVRLSEESQTQMNVPIVHDGKTIGVLTVEHNIQASYSPDDISFVTQLLSQASIAMNNIQLVSNLAEERDRLQVLLDSMTEAILLVHAGGAILQANPGAKSLLNLPQDRLLNQSIETLLNDSSLNLATQLGFEVEPLKTTIKQMMEGKWSGEEGRHEYVIETPQRRVIQRTIAPVKDTNGKIIGMLMVFDDITEQYDLERTREEISGMIVHDLRSPLTAITASLRLMRDISNPEDSIGKTVIQTTEVSSRAIRKMLNLVNSLLDIAKMESGIIDLDREPTSLKTVAENVVTELQPLAAEMDVTLVNEVADHIPVVHIDADKIERTIYNLVDNAIKFTPSHGKVSVRTAIANNTMRIEIADTGPGVPDEYKPVLFNRYAQVKNQRGRRRGTGLGLTFCKLTVEAHGGTIWIEDNPSGGSIFVFTVPLVQDTTLASSVR